MHAHRGLAILERREFLSARGGDGRIARDDLFGQAAHRFQAQRQGNHIEQQPVVTGTVSRQHIGLRRSANCNDLVRIEVGQRGLLEEIGHSMTHTGHPGRSAHHDNALDLIHAQVCIA